MKPSIQLLLAASLIFVACKPSLTEKAAVEQKNWLRQEEPPQPVSAPFTFISEEGVHAILVVPDALPSAIEATVDLFIDRVRRSTGKTLATIKESNAGAAENRLARVYLRVAGINGDELTNALEPESFRLRVAEGSLEVHASADQEVRANPKVRSRPLLWALNSLLEQGLGARWLWPGELGTYLPENRRFSVNVADEVLRPELEQRVLRLNLKRTRPMISRDPKLNARLETEAAQWAEDHRMGDRSEAVFGHAFGHWWKRYSKDHPDYFAILPAPLHQPFPNPGAVKLRLANPAVIEQIATEYEQAGAPRYWNVCPNDGSGFDTSPETLAWDLPQGQDLSAIVGARANLTARYVKFWNLLYDRLVKINPDVVLVTYAYSAYRTAPPSERPLTAKVVLQIVDHSDAFESWKGWTNTGGRAYLRPNWWHHGADAPYLNYRANNRFVRFAYDHGLLGINMDSVLGYWATQGINYYMIARLSCDKTLSDEQLLEEYTAAFGQAAPKIREYLTYWQKLTEKYDYASTVAYQDGPTHSEYQKLVRRGVIPRSVLNGSKYVLPHLYSEEVLAPAYAILDQADALVDDLQSEAGRRVAFLRSGLDSLKITRDQIALGQKLKLTPSPELMKEFVKRRKEMESLREQWADGHIIWAEAARIYEERYKILLRETVLQSHDINLDGWF